jgi:glutathione synthase
MINKIVAIQGNHPSKLNPKSDTSIFLAFEAQNRKYKIFYYEPKDLSIINDKVVAKGYYINFSYSNRNLFKIISKQMLDLSKCKYLLIRQDPPFNLEYISTTYILDKIKDKVKIINNPTSIRNISEKLYSASYQKFMPNTIFTKDINEITKFFTKNKKIILKPIHSFSGNDIHLIEKKINKKMILNFIKKHGHIMCQKFLPKIKFGDKRVFLINGKICGAISRVPKKGSFLSNMSKGAIPIATKLTKAEKKISNLIAKDLKKNNVYFSGIDFIDQKLNGDINVTSPTGLKTFYDLTNINLAKNFWKGLGA